ncbi:MAG: hypothetical protein ACOZBH_02565 [Patescibacteria group bacterium]
MSDKFEKILKLIGQTHDKCIFFDDRTENCFVIMPIDEYEKMSLEKQSDVSDLTQGELLDKINQDIAIWKESRMENDFDWTGEDKEEFSDSSQENDERYYLEPVE